MLRQKRETGSLQRLPARSGAKRTLSNEHRSWLSKQIKEKPDATLGELKENLQAKKKVTVSRATISRQLQELGLPRKKNRSSHQSAAIAKERGMGDK